MRNFEEVPLDLLAWSDTQFRLTFRRVPERLQFSVRELGILNPLIVHETLVPGRFIIVTGWLRFLAAKESEDHSVPCHIFRGIPPKIMLLCSLFDNLGHRVLNPIEQALAVAKLEEFYTREQIAENFLPLLGIRTSAVQDDAAWARLLELKDLPEALCWAISDGIMVPEAGVALARIPYGHLERLVLLYRGFRAASAVQLEIARGFAALWSERDITPTELILDEEWNWASPPEEDLPWPKAPEAAGGTLPIPVEDPDEEAERAHIAALLDDLAASRNSNSGGEARGERVGRNHLAPGGSVCSSEQILRLFSTRVPEAEGGPDPVLRPSSPVAGEPLGRFGIFPGEREARAASVLQAIRKRLGQTEAAPAQPNGTTPLPEGVRVIRSRKPGAQAGVRVELQARAPGEFRSLLQKLLAAEERGELTRILTGKT